MTKSTMTEWKKEIELKIENLERSALIRGATIDNISDTWDSMIETLGKLSEIVKLMADQKGYDDGYEVGYKDGYHRDYDIAAGIAAASALSRNDDEDKNNG